ncbi:MAG: OmpA family protein, partial [Rhodospirillales bacterium]|nr:OmpA family protein [Rhodospirillales bacterium]
MSFFETIIRDLNKRFGLGVHAGALVMEALRTITSRQSGGLPGFLDRFRSAGLGDLVGSWIGTGENTAIEPTQLESALGSDFISRMAAKVGLSPSVATPALAYLIPKVVNHMTPDGTIPSHLPADVSTFLAGDMPTTSTAAAAHAVADPAYTGATAGAPASAGPSSRGGGILRKLIPLLGLLLLGLVAYWFFGRGGEQTAERAPTPTAPSVQAPAAGGQGEVAAAPSQLALRNADGQILYTGSVPNQQTSTGILDALKAVFGSAIAGNLSIDPNATAPDWLGKLSDALAAFNIPGADMLLKGNEVGIGGAISDAQKSDLIGRLKSVFGEGMSVGALGQSLADMFAGIATPTVATAAPASPTAGDPAAAAKAANDKSLVALQGLPSGYSASQLVDVLNASVINFETGSAVIPADSQTFLQSVAGTMSKAPAGTHIEIGGHTDSTGDPEKNLALSQARADAV